MSALRYDTGKLQPLSRDEDMAFVGGGQRRARAHSAMIEFLKNNPQDARVLGHVVRRMRRNLQDAFPGETRERTYSNEDWRAAGYADVAEVNSLLGLQSR